tara:strand:+ start:356 stop:622 length:267 start_codon:yes stop_codon:yes gene_type:complete
MSKWRTRITHIFSTLISIVPHISWWPYAASRLGTFIMVYLGTLATTVVGFTIAGITISLGAILALVPVAVFLAIRISGALTAKMNKGE